MQNAVEQPPKFLGRWAGAYTINIFVMVWVFLIGFGFGGWASVTNFVHQIDTIVTVTPVTLEFFGIQQLLCVFVFSIFL